VRYDKNCILIPAHYAVEHFASGVLMGVNAVTFIPASRKPYDTVKATNALWKSAPCVTQRTKCGLVKYPSSGISIPNVLFLFPGHLQLPCYSRLLFRRFWWYEHPHFFVA